MKRIRYKSKSTEQDSVNIYRSDDTISLQRKPMLDLPQIRKRTYFTDDISVSQDYIKVT